MHVSWTGDIVDISAPPDGGIVAFIDWNCEGGKVEIDPREFEQFYMQTIGGKSHRWKGHAAAARFHVQGTLTYYRDRIVLKTSGATQLNEWKTDDEFTAYMKRQFETFSKRHPKFSRK